MQELEIDHLHIILDALQHAQSANIPEHFAAGYDYGDDDEEPKDPKNTPEGWEQLRGQAEAIVKEMLGKA